MSEFKREPRYIVFKISDIENYLTKDDKAKLLFIGDTIACARKFQGRPPFNAAVVEQDWPEFDVVWQMIEARVTAEKQPCSL